MRYFVFLLLVLVGLWSASSQASPYSFMSFKINSFGPHQYDYSSVWNPVTQEATLRIGLVPEKLDSLLADKTISFSGAQKADYVATDFPEILENCTMMSHWQFEYSPGLPNYLMFATLKGPNCQRVAEVFDILQIRMRFMGVSLEGADPVDVVVDISR